MGEALCPCWAGGRHFWRRLDFRAVRDATCRGNLYCVAHSFIFISFKMSDAVLTSENEMSDAFLAVGTVHFRGHSWTYILALIV